MTQHNPHPRPKSSFRLQMFVPFLVISLTLLAFDKTRPVAAQTAQDVHPLETGKPVERELAGGQSHSYRLTLAAGQYLHAVVEQRGIDVVVTLFGPGGKKLLEVDSNGTQGAEPLRWIVETVGLYRMEVRSLENAAKPGRYEVRLVELRVPASRDRDLAEADKLYNESESLRRSRQYNQAIPLVERALSLREKVLGTEHPETATSLNNLANLYFGNGDYGQAERLYRRALAVREKVLGAEHPRTADLLYNLALVYGYKGDYQQAEPLFRRALAIREKVLGAEHPDTATSLHNLAVLYTYKGDYEQAELLHRRALAIRERVLGMENSDTATSLHGLADLYFDRRDYTQAEPLLRRALAIQEKALGADHPDTAKLLNNLAIIYSNKGDDAQAASLYRRALAIREKMLGPEHPDTADTLNNLAIIYSTTGDYEQAELLYRRALAIREKTRGREHPDTATSIDSLANLYSAKGDYPQAESLYHRALAIREKALGAEHPHTTASLSNLAILYEAKGDYEQAESLHRRVLAIREKSLGAEHPDTARSLHNLAVIYHAKGDYAQAEQLNRRVLAIREKTLGAGHLDTAKSLNNLANLYLRKGDYAQAEPLLSRTLTIYEKSAGHPDTAVLLNNLAMLYEAKGDYAQAEMFLRRAMAIQEKTLGAEHPDTAGSLYNLSQLYASTGDISRAVSFRSRAQAIEEHNIALNLATGSERQKLAYLKILADRTAYSVDLHVHLAPANQTARDLALTAILQRKGRVLEALNDGTEALRRRAHPQDRALLDQLKAERAQLAKLVLGGPQRVSPEEYRQAIQRLEESVEKLEAEISSRSAEFRIQSQPITIAAVQAAIPLDAALIEFFRYDYKEARYVAYVLRPRGEAQWVDLGEAAAIEQAVDKLRRALRDPARRDVKRLARAVEQMVMQPVRALLGETRRVFISPDGALNLIPFAALTDERNRYLVERYELSYLTSGRDLLRLQLPRASQPNVLIVADPDFGETTATGRATNRLLKYGASAQSGGTEGSILADAYFPPLAGTADEALALKALLPAATVLTRQQATETALKKASSPRILHIATHGFFLADLKDGDGRGRELKQVSLSAELPVNQRVENPLLRSGLALAGANRLKSGGDDGILTAMETVGLDLWGTKLVVLSACETGLGDVRNGEGVYGLRRALVLAGSETQVMSLWPVSDKATRDLMIEYYARLQRGEGRTEALRNVQLKMLRRQEQGSAPPRGQGVKGAKSGVITQPAGNYSHPYYWASFIQSGDWRKLD